jgi:hypothetical protein
MPELAPVTNAFFPANAIADSFDSKEALLLERN